MKTPTDFMLNAYREGVFPMAESAEDEGFAFYKPHMRALLPIRTLHIPKSLLKTIKRKPYSVTTDQSFEKIIRGCAQRESTWINEAIIQIFLQLHAEGQAHSVECWSGDGSLAGGLYGVSIGAVFCGESMVSFQKDGSKIAFVHLCALLDHCGYTTLDSQFMNENIARFGAYEIPQEEYVQLIQREMGKTTRPFNSVQINQEMILEYLRMNSSLREGRKTSAAVQK
jgi:leucyl/phenylalanyl-tRNA--protein transferase